MASTPMNDLSADTSNMQHSMSSYGDDESHSESPFFADITMDIAEAHDLAMTPEPHKLKLNINTNGGDVPRMPQFVSSSSDSSTPRALVSGGATVPGDRNEPMKSVQGSFAQTYNPNQTTPSLQRYPRDVPWAVAFCIFVPVSLFLPLLAKNSTFNDIWMATASAPRQATWNTMLWGFVATLVLGRMLYRTMGGGDGDDARHAVSQIILASAPISVSVYISMIVALYFMLPGAMHFAVVPLWYLVRDLWLFRRWKITSTTPGGRQAFFQALTCMTLDILSRSLRRQSFYRVVSILLLVQLGVCWLWHVAILGALRSRSVFLLLLAVVGGKWATGTVARLLSLIASGGISSWFAEQNSLVQELNNSSTNMQPIDEEVIDFNNGTSDNTKDGSMTEEYRTADGSAYKSALGVPDEGMDDDFEDEEEGLSPTHMGRPTATATGKGSTVKAFLFSGLGVSFGSVAKCGLLGGFAQFLWSQLRKIDTAQATLGGLRGMDIGGTDQSAMGQLLLKANMMARSFVRSHSDMAMSHVAAYQKTYQRAAQDVAILVEEKGE
jgi:hypothetical protein